MGGFRRGLRSLLSDLCVPPTATLPHWGRQFQLSSNIRILVISERGHAHHGLAKSHRTLWLLLSWDGGDRIHAALLAAVPGREGAVGSRDRDRFDPGGAFGPGPVSRSASGRTGSAGASRSWSSRWRWSQLSTVLLRDAHGVLWLGFLVILFAENGISRAVVESLSGAEAAALAPPGGVGAALGALRFWKPIGIVLVALLGSWMSEQYGVGAILLPLAIAQGLAVGCALLIHETPRRHESKESASGGAAAISKREASRR